MKWSMAALKRQRQLEAEAMTAFDRTGCTPRQLVEQRAELLALVERLADAEGSLLVVRWSDEWEEAEAAARALIAKVKGERA